MKSIAKFLASWLPLATGCFLAGQIGAGEILVLNTPRQKESYAVGADLARNLKRQGVQLDTQALLQGMHDVLANSGVLMSEEEIRDTLRAMQVELKRKQLQLRRPAIVAQENRERGAAFLAQNKTNPGVVSLPSGLQYKVITTGQGPKPGETNTVECRFRGTLLNGEEFCGPEGGKAVPFQMKQVIRGWREALQLMPQGSKWQLFIPPALAYGENGMGGSKIGPNATLIYELELVAIE